MINWHPWPGLFVGILGLLAIAVPLLREKKMGRYERAVWIFIFVLLTIGEIRSLKLAADDFEADRARANQKFDGISQRLTTALENSQAQFAATMAKMGHLTEMEKQQIDEAMGGDTFCDMEIIAIVGRSNIASDGSMSTSLSTIGRHPMSNVQVTVIDVNEANRLHKLQGYGLDTINAGTIVFPYAYLTQGRSILPFITIHWSPNDTDKRYTILTTAKNGTFAQLLRLKRIEQSNEARVANMLSAAFFDGRRGLIYRQVNDDFPKESLDSENDWRDMEKLKHLTVSATPGFVQFK